MKNNYGTKIEKYEDVQKKQNELGMFCVQNQIEKKHLVLMTSIIRYGKLDLMEYVIDHCLNMEALEKAYQDSHPIWKHY